MTYLRAAFAMVVLPAALLAAAASALVLVAVGASQGRVDILYRGFARLCLRVGGTRVVVHGGERLAPGRAYVVVPNHESLWDPMVLVGALHALRVRFVLKAGLARVPVLGGALLQTGNVQVERTHTAADVARLREGLATRAPDVSLLFFAEGTRSRDGALHPFKMGAFASAIGAGLPILPVAIAGTHALLPPDTLRLRAGTVVVEIGEPIEIAGRDFAARARLRDETWAAVRLLRRRARQRLRFFCRPETSSRVGVGREGGAFGGTRDRNAAAGDVGAANEGHATGGAHHPWRGSSR